MSASLGPAYDEQLDGERLRKQHIKIRTLMLDNQWRTLHEISESLGYPEASISAQLRHLRKPEYGNYNVVKRRRSQGTWEYRVSDSQFSFVDGQGVMFEPTVKHSMAGH